MKYYYSWTVLVLVKPDGFEVNTESLCQTQVVAELHVYEVLQVIFCLSQELLYFLKTRDL